MVISDVRLGLSQENHDVDTLLDLLRWEMRLEHVNVELVVAEDPNVFVGTVVMGPECIHLVEDLAQVLLHFTTD